MVDIVALLAGWTIGLAIGIFIITRPAFQRLIMGTVPRTEEQQPAPDRIARELIAGHPHGAVRRIVLYLVAILAFMAAALLGGGTVAVPCLVGVAAVGLLALSDQLS